MRLVDPNVTAVDARDGRALTRGGRRGFPPGVGVLGELRTFAARFHRLGFCLVPGMLARLPSEPRAGAAQRMLTPLLSAIAGTELTPTYTFSVDYAASARLMPRVDTEGLEFAVALRVASGTEATEPPLWLHTLSGPVPITQSWGDGVFYQGRELEHYRGPAVPDSQPKVMFLHYLAARDQARFY